MTFWTNHLIPSWAPAVRRLEVFISGKGKPVAVLNVVLEEFMVRRQLQVLRIYAVGDASGVAP